MKTCYTLREMRAAGISDDAVDEHRDKWNAIMRAYSAMECLRGLGVPEEDLEAAYELKKDEWPRSEYELASDDSPFGDVFAPVVHLVEDPADVTQFSEELAAGPARFDRAYWSRSRDYAVLALLSESGGSFGFFPAELADQWPNVARSVELTSGEEAAGRSEEESAQLAAHNEQMLANAKEFVESLPTDLIRGILAATVKQFFSGEPHTDGMKSALLEVLHDFGAMGGSIYSISKDGKLIPLPDLARALGVMPQEGEAQ